jgi:hypothetical protein
VSETGILDYDNVVVNDDDNVVNDDDNNKGSMNKLTGATG